MTLGVPIHFQNKSTVDRAITAAKFIEPNHPGMSSKTRQQKRGSNGQREPHSIVISSSQPSSPLSPKDLSKEKEYN